MQNSTYSLGSPSILNSNFVISDKLIKNKQCVACLSTDKDLAPISDSLSAELLYLANVEVNKDEYICGKCMIQLNSACHFKRQCLFSHEKIKSSTSFVKDSKSVSLANDSELKMISSNQKKIISESTNPFITLSKTGNTQNKFQKKTSTEQIELVKKGRLPSLNKDKKQFLSDQHFAKKKSSIENSKDKGVRSKSADNVANYYGKVCREVFSKLETYKKYKSRHFSQLTNLFINELGPIAKNKGNETSGICSSCGKMFKQLNKHILVCPCIKRKGKKLCDKCGKVLTDLTKHKCVPEKSASGTKTYPCEKCGKMFNNYKSLWSHKKIVHSANKSEFKCLDCPKSYSTASGRREHTLTKHGSGSLPHACTTCSKHFVSTTKLKRHITTHNNNPLAFECFLCPASYTRTVDLANHLKSEHNNIFLHPEEVKRKLSIKS